MNIKLWMVLAATLAAGLAIPPLRAQKPETKAPHSPQHAGIIKGDNVNVRGKPSLTSEVVAQLNSGDRVIILEELTLKDPAAGEPDKWLRIALPQNVPVWIHASYVDPATKTVKATHLNLRSGPGENYSVLGHIAAGTAIKELETQGNWLRIEPPAETFAFVAAFLVSPQAGAPPSELAAAKPAPQPAIKPAPTAPAASPPPIAAETNLLVVPPPIIPPQPPPIEAVTLEPPVIGPGATQPMATAPPAATAPGETLLPEEMEPGAPELILDQEPEPAEPPPKRIVHREGIVRRSVSIQAPTYFALEDVRNRRTINYLHSSVTNNVVLKDYYGARVLVTGEELLDERWPNTPVINIESLRTVP